MGPRGPSTTADSRWNAPRRPPTTGDVEGLSGEKTPVLFCCCQGGECRWVNNLLPARGRGNWRSFSRKGTVPGCPGLCLYLPSSTHSFFGTPEYSSRDKSPSLPWGQRLTTPLIPLLLLFTLSAPPGGPRTPPGPPESRTGVDSVVHLERLTEGNTHRPSAHEPSCPDEDKHRWGGGTRTSPSHSPVPGPGPPSSVPKFHTGTDNGRHTRVRLVWEETRSKKSDRFTSTVKAGVDRQSSYLLDVDSCLDRLIFPTTYTPYRTGIDTTW